MTLVKILLVCAFLAFATIMVEMRERKNEAWIKLWAAISATLVAVSGLLIAIEGRNALELILIGIFIPFVVMLWLDWWKNRK